MQFLSTEDTTLTTNIKERAEIERPWTARQLAEIVPLHPNTLLRWAREGRIPSTRLSSRRVVFMPSDIRAWLVNSSSTAYAEPATRVA